MKETTKDGRAHRMIDTEEVEERRKMKYDDGRHNDRKKEKWKVQEERKKESTKEGSALRKKKREEVEKGRKIKEYDGR